MPNGIYNNTHDWSKDLQPHINKLYGFDGDPEILSEKDLQIAQRMYCKDSFSNDAIGRVVSAIVCDNIEKAKLFVQKAEYLYDLRSRFSNNNPIHKHLKLDSELISPNDIPNDITKCYNLLGQILVKVKDHLQKNPNLPPQEKLEFVYQAMVDAKIELEEKTKPLFAVNLLEKELNCDTSSFVVLAIAHEFGWPVHLVVIDKHTGGHVFVRWQGKDIQFNIDRGKILPDSFYETKYRVKKTVLEKSATYLTLIYNSHGLTRLTQEKYDDAIKDFDLAIKSNPKFAVAYMNRGVAKAAMGRYKEAIKDYDIAIKLNPEFATVYYNRGIAKAALQKYDEAIKDYDETIGLDPKYTDAFYNRGLVKAALQKYEAAIIDYNEATKLNPKHADAWYNLATLYFHKIKDVKNGCACIKRAYELDPNNQQYSKLFNEMECGI